MVATFDIEQLGFDPDALRARYRAERDKRLRPDGIGQFIEPTGDFKAVDRESRRAGWQLRTPGR
jgi:hypothetical protein